MSSRSLATARARRSGENMPPVSGNRPGMSNASNSTFAPQPPYPPTNVRLARSSQGQPPLQQQQQQQEPMQNKLPFNKLTISDAIGLITLRLGRVEQWIIETDHENSTENPSLLELPENSRVIDNSIFTNIINRLDSLEKNITNKGDSSQDFSEDFLKLSEEVTTVSEQLARVSDETTKHTLAVSKHSEQLLRFEREFVETKDILKTFMLKYDNFVKETNDKFVDYEVAIEEIEKNIQLQLPNELEKEVVEEVQESEEVI